MDDQIIDNYEFILDNIIKTHKNSLKDILITLRNTKYFEDDVLLRLISYLKVSKLYELNCEYFPLHKFYILKLGESNYIFYKNRHCDCIKELSDKINLKNLCIHFLLYKILLYTEKLTKIQVQKENFENLIISSTNIN